MKQILHHGIIHTMNPSQPLAEAVLIEDEKYTAVGSNEQILALASAEDQVIDLQGAAMYPGMIDSHLHILNLAITSRNLVLNQFHSRADVIQAIREHAAQYPEGSVIDGRGFNEDLWDDKRLITRAELDQIAPCHAVRLTRVCGHMVIGNTLAIQNAGVNEQTPVPEGGEIDLSRGIFNENAINLLFPEDGDGGVDLCKELLSEGMRKAADAGLTGIWTDDFYTYGYSMHTVAEAYRQLEAEGNMPVRVVQQCALANDELWQEFNQSGFFYGQGSNMYRIGPRKLYADGSLGARTACLTVPYADQPERQGVPIYSQDELNRLAAQTHRAGMPFIVHAIGDAATDSVLDAIAYARAAVPGTDNLPSGIVHCQITRPDQLKRIADLHAVVYAQPVFVEYDLHICKDRTGAELEKTSYNWKSMLDAGVNISSGSDCPVEPLDPAKNIYCAVTRKDFEYQPQNGWLPDQCLTVEEAIRCHTVEAAKAIGYEDRLGQIAPGYLADASVFPNDFFQIAPDEILTQKPLFTMVSGHIRACPQA